MQHTVFIMLEIQSDQKVSVYLMNTIQKTGAQRLFDHPVYYNCVNYIYIQSDQKVSFHLMNTIQKTGAQRLSDHPVY